MAEKKDNEFPTVESMIESLKSLHIKHLGHAPTPLDDMREEMNTIEEEELAIATTLSPETVKTLEDVKKLEPYFITTEGKCMLINKCLKRNLCQTMSDAIFMFKIIKQRDINSPKIGKAAIELVLKTVQLPEGEPDIDQKNAIKNAELLKDVIGTEVPLDLLDFNIDSKVPDAEAVAGDKLGECTDVEKATISLIGTLNPIMRKFNEMKDCDNCDLSKNPGREKSCQKILDDTEGINLMGHYLLDATWNSIAERLDFEGPGLGLTPDWKIIETFDMPDFPPDTSIGGFLMGLLPFLAGVSMDDIITTLADKSGLEDILLRMTGESGTGDLPMDFMSGIDIDDVFSLPRMKGGKDVFLGDILKKFQDNSEDKK